MRVRTFGSWSPSTEDEPVSKSSWSLHLTDWSGSEQVENTAKAKGRDGKILIKVFLEARYHNHKKHLASLTYTHIFP